VVVLLWRDDLRFGHSEGDLSVCEELRGELLLGEGGRSGNLLLGCVENLMLLLLLTLHEVLRVILYEGGAIRNF
jgi:hypothetical protein